MRASMMVPSALAALVLGCTRGSPTTKPDAADTDAALESRPNGGGAADALAVLEPVFVPLPDGGASEVLRKDAPNMRYVQLDRDACLAELGRRAIAFEELSTAELTRTSRRWAAKTTPEKKQTKPAHGGKPATKRPATKPVPRSKHVPQPPPPPPPTTHLLAPIRLGGPLHGIAFHSALPEKQRTKSTSEIFDCRLVLALDDFAALLADHGVTEVIHMSAFRSQGERGCTPKYVGKQHCAALAVDVGVFKKSDGSALEVERDFNGKIGMTTCTTGAAPTPATPAAAELWSIVCNSAQRGLFHVILTPNYNEEHRNHFHLEITPEVDWMMIR